MASRLCLRSVMKGPSDNNRRRHNTIAPNAVLAALLLKAADFSRSAPDLLPETHSCDQQQSRERKVPPDTPHKTKVSSIDPRSLKMRDELQYHLTGIKHAARRIRATSWQERQETVTQGTQYHLAEKTSRWAIRPTCPREQSHNPTRRLGLRSLMRRPSDNSGGRHNTIDLAAALPSKAAKFIRSTQESLREAHSCDEHRCRERKVPPEAPVGLRARRWARGGTWRRAHEGAWRWARGGTCGSPSTSAASLRGVHAVTGERAHVPKRRVPTCSLQTIRCAPAAGGIC